MARFAVALQHAATGIVRSDGQPFRLRIGLHSGPAVGGVIGTSKRAFDLWGDTVNIARRLETDGEVGRIHLSAATAKLIEGSFSLEDRGELQL